VRFSAAAKGMFSPPRDHRIAFAVHAPTHHFGSETKLLGQFGVGLEFRIARHVGLTEDLSFGVIEGPQNNFGMFRSGLNFVF
jgi:hypothetical protein